MNILHLSQPNSEAAGIAAYDVHFGLIEKGYNSHLIVQFDKTAKLKNNVSSYYSSFEWYYINTKRKIKNKIKKYLVNKNINNKYNLHSINEKEIRTNLKRIIKLANFKPDVVFIYFTQNFINSRLIKELYNYYKVPIYWYLMDMSAFTGGCHYTWECNGYKNDCGKCPAIYSNDKYDITFKNLLFKKNNLQDIDLKLICISEWQLNKAKESSLFRDYSIRKILLPINVNLFKPNDKNKIREQLGLPKSKKIFFFGAQSLRDPRKGISDLLSAINLVQKDSKFSKYLDNAFFIYAGSSPEFVKKKLQVENKYLGILNNNQLAEVYQCSDFFICPSLQDAGCYMITLSLACGVPVIAYEMGWACEFVKTNITGYKAQLGNVEDLAEGIKYALILDNQKYEIMKNNCVAIAKTYLTREKQIEQIEELLNEIKKSKE